MSHDSRDLIDKTKQSNCCGAPIMLGDICSECKEHCEADPTCPEYGSSDISERHVLATFNTPEVRFTECADCGHQWNHQ